MQTIHVEDLSALLVAINQLMLAGHPGRWVFRGQNNAGHPIMSTFARRFARCPEQFRGYVTGQAVSQFAQGLAAVGDASLLSARPQVGLEMARHFGVPSPLIDFTYSPFVALWFAFDGTQVPVFPGVPTESVTDCRALYAFNTEFGGIHFEKTAYPDPDSEIAGRPVALFYNGDRDDVFDDEFPDKCLRFIGVSSHQNTRMVRQRGCFLYDTMQYSLYGVSNFDEFFGDAAVMQSQGTKVHALIKFIIPGRCSEQVFTYLDAIGIDGAFLLADASGAAADVVNMLGRPDRFHIPQD